MRQASPDQYRAAKPSERMISCRIGTNHQPDRTTADKPFPLSKRTGRRVDGA